MSDSPRTLLQSKNTAKTLRRMSEKHVSTKARTTPHPQLAILSYLYFEVSGVCSGDLLEFAESEVL